MINRYRNTHSNTYSNTHSNTTATPTATPLQHLVVDKIGGLHLQPLCQHQGALLEEAEAVEVALELLVGVVDAELLVGFRV